MTRPEKVGADDVAIAGGGMAGLCAALAAAQAGASVTVYEADGRPGGSARWSSGRVWAARDYAQLRTAIPLGDARLQRLLSAGFDDAIEWLSQAVGVMEPQDSSKFGRGRVMQRGTVGDRTEYFARFAEVCETFGVRFEHRMALSKVVRASDQLDAGGNDNTVGQRQAHAVVLATGGFQASAAERARRIGPEAIGLAVRSNKRATGRGLTIGLDLGATTSRGMSWFYGKSMPPGVGQMAPQQFKSLTYDVARASMALNLEGRRFVEEASGVAGEGIANAGLMQPGGRYVLLFGDELASRIDRAALQDHAHALGEAAAPLMLSSKGYRQLAADMQEHWNVDAQRVVETVSEINKAVEAGQRDSIIPAYRGAEIGNDDQCHALVCVPAITQTLGGLWVDDNMSVLDSNGSPLSAVYAAGADAGGAFTGSYGGGLGWALVSGRSAGLTAAAFAKSCRAGAAQILNLSVETS